MPSNVVTVQSTKLGQLIITLPRALAETKGWTKGTRLKFIENTRHELILEEA